MVLLRHKLPGKDLFPRVRRSLALPFPAGTSRNAPMPAAPEFSSASDHVHRSGDPASIPATGHSLRSETAWFPRSRPPLAIRRPSATIRQDRFWSQAPVATPATLPHFHRRRLLPPLMACRLHSAPAPARRALSLLEEGKVSRAAPSAFRMRSNAAGLLMLALVAPLAHP